MNKQVFLSKLRKGLSKQPKKEVEERLNFYSEMIDDRIEEGVLEETAVAQIGTIDEILLQIKTDLSATQIEKETFKEKRKVKTLEIVLLSLGSPLWLTLLITLIVLIITFYVVLWVIPIAFWSVFATFCVCSLSLFILGILYMFVNYTPFSIAILGFACILLGLSIFLYFGCKSATKGVVIVTKKSINSIF